MLSIHQLILRVVNLEKVSEINLPDSGTLSKTGATGVQEGGRPIRINRISGKQG